MKKIFTLFTALCILNSLTAQTYHPLATSAFSQNWTNAALITTTNDWSGVPSIQGFLGDDAASTATGVDPQTFLLGSYSTTLNAIANQNSPNTLTNGGVAEFDGIPNPTVALQGSGTADAPNIVVYLNTTGRSGVIFSFLARDIDASTDNSIQPIAVQYRVGTTGDFINIPAGFIADASTGPSLDVQTTPVSFTLPAAAQNQAQVQVRIVTNNAAGSDEWIGIDDINVTQGTSLPTPLSLTSFNASFNGKAAQLNWTTANEVNVHGFSVEKSLNGKEFSEIGFVAAKNSNLQTNYSLDDINVKGGANYYRLKMIDKDASVKFSQVVMVNNKSMISVEVFPNPVVANLSVNHPKAWAAAISILNAEGRQVKKYTVQQGTMQTSFSVSGLSKGNYLLVFESDGAKSITKFVKQ